MYKLLAGIAAVGALAVSGPTIALAANPHNMNGSPATGQPSQDCTSPQLLTSRPGNSASSPGAPFNEGVGTGGLAYNAAGAPSQYDVACFQASVRP